MLRQQKFWLPRRGSVIVLFSQLLATAAAPNFYVIAREQGTESANVPLWASHERDPFQLGNHRTDDHDQSCFASNASKRVDVPEVPGAFQILNVLTKEESKRMGECQKRTELLLVSIRRINGLKSDKIPLFAFQSINLKSWDLPTTPRSHCLAPFDAIKICTGLPTTTHWK